MKVIETQEILDVIYKFGNPDPKELFLKVKSKGTNEIRNVVGNYVADEKLFIFTSADAKPRTCAEYIISLETESLDSCWDSYLKEEESDDVQEDSKRRLDFIIGLETKVYFGDIESCPIKDGNYGMILEIEKVGNDIILVY